MLELAEQGGITRRSPSIDTKYRAFLDNWDQSRCVFCDRDQVVVASTTYMRVLKNDFPYELLEGARVIDHLLVVPIRHVLHLDDFTHAERDDFFMFISHYENDGYNIKERAQQNLKRSVAHNHTHLIKLEYSL